MNCQQDTLINDLRGLGLPHTVSEWLSLQMLTRWNCGTQLDYPLEKLDSIKCQSFIIDTCVKFFRFRPTDHDVAQAIESKQIATIADLASAISFLLGIAPSIDDEVQALNPTNCSASTQALWKDLSGLLPEDYNDQFALKCFLDRHTFVEAIERDASIDNLDSLNLKDSLCWWPRFLSHDLEAQLKHAKYELTRTQQIKSCTEIHANTGDIVKLGKHGGSDSMVQFLLISKAVNSAIELVEFKPRFGGPYLATSKGLDLFFFRDPAIAVEGVWSK